MRAIVLMCALVGIAGCATPASRIATELERYGLDAQRAECVGQRLERDLTTRQLRELAASARAFAQHDSTPDRLTASDLLRVAGSVRDPAVPITVFRAATGCGVTVADVLR